MLAWAGLASFAAFPAAAVSVTGALQSWTYAADSGNTATRNRCTVCGSQVTSGTSGMSVTAINLTLIEGPSSINPGMVFFHAKAQPWDQLDPTLPTFAGMPTM